MKRVIIISAVVLVLLNASLFVKNKNWISGMASIADTNLSTQTETPASLLCNNYGEDIEIKDFKKPIPVVWTAKLDICATACDGATFIRVPEDKKYPRFYGDFDSNSGQLIKELVEKTTRQNWPESDMKYTFKVYGDWIGINYDRAFYVLVPGLCVPIVNIKKIEIVK